MQTLMKLNRHSFSTERFVVTTCGCEHERTLANFIAAVASGGITIEVIDTHWPDAELFVGNDENYLDHAWETVEDAKPAFNASGVIKQKSPLLVRLEAKNKAQEKKAA